MSFVAYALRCVRPAALNVPSTMLIIANDAHRNANDVPMNAARWLARELDSVRESSTEGKGVKSRVLYGN
jgi:hypothetical protein